MARTTTVKPEMIDSTDVFLPVDDSSNDMSAENLLVELGGVSDEDAKVTVYRVNAKDGRRNDSWVMECHPSEFSIARLAQEFGGGQYRIAGIKFDASRNQKVRFCNRIVTIEGVRETTPYISAARAVAQQPTASIDGNVLSAIQQGFERLAQSQLQMMQAMQQPKIDPAQMRRELLQDMAMMREIMVGNNGNNTGAVEMLLKGIELARDLSPAAGEAGTADILLEALKTFGKPIAQTVLAQAAQSQQIAPLISNNPVSSENQQILPQVEMNRTEAPVIDTTIKEAEMLKYYISQLLVLAKDTRDPSLYAELIVDQLPDEQLNAIVSRADFIPWLISVNPEISGYVPWFEELRASIMEILTQAPESDQTIEHVRTVTDTHNRSIDGNSLGERGRADNTSIDGAVGKAV